jgi:hypothetical protein
MAHNLVKFITDDDGAPMEPLWHFPMAIGDANRAICSGHVFGEGESEAKYQVKIVQRGGITCPECLSIIRSFKKVKL